MLFCAVAEAEANDLNEVVAQQPSDSDEPAINRKDDLALINDAKVSFLIDKDWRVLEIICKV